MTNDFGCFVINLKKDTERRDQMSRQLEALGIPYRVFNAVYGKSLTDEEMARHYDKKRAVSMSHDLTRSELGCALSHVFVYKKIVEESMPCALVLEDDAQLSDDLPEILAQLSSKYKSTESMVFLLNHVRKYKNRKTVRINESYQVANIYGTPVRAHGYFITLAAAKKLLENLYPVWAVADEWAVFNKNYVTVKAVVPYCIGLSACAQLSNLEEERKDIKLKRSIGYHFYHYFYHKFINQIFVRPFLRVAKQDETW